MAEEVITIEGEDKVVREDEAKSFRGVKWALISIFGFALITAAIFVVFFIGASADGGLQNPRPVEQQRP